MADKERMNDLSRNKFCSLLTAVLQSSSIESLSTYFQVILDRTIKTFKIKRFIILTVKLSLLSVRMTECKVKDTDRQKHTLWTDSFVRGLFQVKDWIMNK